MNKITKKDAVLFLHVRCLMKKIFLSVNPFLYKACGGMGGAVV